MVILTEILLSSDALVGTLWYRSRAGWDLSTVVGSGLFNGQQQVFSGAD